MTRYEELSEHTSRIACSMPTSGRTSKMFLRSKHLESLVLERQPAPGVAQGGPHMKCGAGASPSRHPRYVLRLA